MSITPRGPALHLLEVSLQLGGTQILDHLNWQVEAGQIHALVGPNGSGKSSLLKSVLGLMPHRGEITLRWPGARPGVVGYVPQSLECDRSLPMTVRDFLAAMCQKSPLFWRLEPRVLAQVQAVLAQVGMEKKAQRRMGDLSGGERQRVLLAQSLLPMPDLLLLDEPMAALDADGLVVFERLLNDWRAHGTTVVWVEHDLDAVRRLSDRVTGLNGRVLFDDVPDVLHDADRLLQLFSLRRTPMPD